MNVAFVSNDKWSFRIKTLNYDLTFGVANVQYQVLNNIAISFFHDAGLSKRRYTQLSNKSSSNNLIPSDIFRFSSVVKNLCKSEDSA